MLADRGPADAIRQSGARLLTPQPTDRVALYVVGDLDEWPRGWLLAQAEERRRQGERQPRDHENSRILLNHRIIHSK